MARYLIDQKSVGVYIAIHKDSVVYIGSSGRCCYNRVLWHMSKLNTRTHTSPGLQQIFDEHGSESIVFQMLEYCKPDECLEKEKFWAKFYRATLLNNRVPGDYSLSQEIRSKQSYSRAVYLETPGARESLSERAKLQHASGRFRRAV